jgi:hypothetical protein
MNICINILFFVSATASVQSIDNAVDRRRADETCSLDFMNLSPSFDQIECGGATQNYDGIAIEGVSYLAMKYDIYPYKFEASVGFQANIDADGDNSAISGTGTIQFVLGGEIDYKEEENALCIEPYLALKILPTKLNVEWGSLGSLPGFSSSTNIGGLDISNTPFFGSDGIFGNIDTCLQGDKPYCVSEYGNDAVKLAFEATGSDFCVTFGNLNFDENGGGFNLQFSVKLFDPKEFELAAEKYCNGFDALPGIDIAYNCKSHLVDGWTDLMNTLCNGDVKTCTVDQIYSVGDLILNTQAIQAVTDTRRLSDNSIIRSDGVVCFNNCDNVPYSSAGGLSALSLLSFILFANMF